MTDIKKNLFDAANKYGGAICSAEDLSSIDSFNSKCQHISLPANGKTILHLREALMQSGTILEEDLDNQSYIARITLRNSYEASIMIVCLHDDSICINAYAREGLFKKNIASKAIEKFKEYFYPTPVE